MNEWPVRENASEEAHMIGGAWSELHIRARTCKLYTKIFVEDASLISAEVIQAWNCDLENRAEELTLGCPMDRPNISESALFKRYC
ncbi:hypothetical protein KIN20_035950 [Parelaphostrongylus tenuis]|uniref:Uncharacterized protein n=1 Tax=Parelaphostrongylus tenuis TaxID=148309 RepID=A0AAD5RCJ4_PARTN|nr:hypothetical protein KIN20_035950 [Parelaphostrongylus tenuis]